MTIFFKKMPNIQCLSFLHLNTRNLSRNIDNLTNMMAEINAKFSVIGISETWLQDISHTVDKEFITTDLTELVVELAFI